MKARTLKCHQCSAAHGRLVRRACYAHTDCQQGARRANVAHGISKAPLDKRVRVPGVGQGRRAIASPPTAVSTIVRAFIAAWAETVPAMTERLRG